MGEEIGMEAKIAAMEVRVSEIINLGTKIDKQQCENVDKKFVAAKADQHKLFWITVKATFVLVTWLIQQLNMKNPKVVTQGVVSVGKYLG